MHHLSRRQSVLLVAAALSGNALEARAQGRKQAAIEIESFENKDEGTAWLAYALGLMAWGTKSGAIDRAPNGLFVPSFDGELEARRAQLQIWKELNEKERMTLPYMDQLLAVEAAGFLREYLWTFHRLPAWTPQPAGLRVSEFEEWRLKSLVGHQPKTGARLRVSS